MRRAVTLLLVLVALALTGCSGSGKGTTSVTYPAGKRPAAPAVQGELLDGGRYDLAGQRGQVIVINFWASWCAPCRAEAADLREVAANTRDLGVSFLGVDIRDDADRARAFTAAHPTGYPSLFDPAGRVALRFTETPPTATPTTLVIDRQGGVAAVFRRPLLREELEPVVRRIAAESPPGSTG